MKKNYLKQIIKYFFKEFSAIDTNTVYIYKFNIKWPKKILIFLRKILLYVKKEIVKLEKEKKRENVCVCVCVFINDLCFSNLLRTI